MHSHDRTLLAKLGFADQDKQDPRHDLACQYLTTLEVMERIVAFVTAPFIKSVDKTCTTTVLTKDEYNHWNDKYGTVFRGRKWTSVGGTGNPSLEHPLSKGDGQYKTTIGFLDVVIPYKIRTDWDGENGKAVREEVWEDSLGKSYSNWNEASEAMSKVRAEFPQFDRGINYHEWDDKCRTHPEWPNSRIRYPVEWRVCRRHEYDDRKLVVEVKITPLGLGDIIRQLKLYREFDFSVAGTYARTPIDWVVATAFPLSDSEVSILRDREKIHHVRLGSSFEKWAEWQKRPSANQATDNPNSITL